MLALVALLDLTSIFNASVLLLIMSFVIKLLKLDNVMTKFIASTGQTHEKLTSICFSKYT